MNLENLFLLLLLVTIQIGIVLLLTEVVEEDSAVEVLEEVSVVEATSVAVEVLEEAEAIDFNLILLG
jgi:hypothetical protein